MNAVRATLLAAALALVSCSSTQRTHDTIGSPEPQNSDVDGGTEAGSAATTSVDAGTMVELPDVVEDTSAAEIPTDAGSTVIATHDRFPIVPMHLVPAAGATGEDAHVDLELRADGSLYSHGHLFGQLAGDRVLGVDGREILSVAPDGTVSLHGTATRVHVTPDGTIALPNGSTLSFADDGSPTMAAAGGAPMRGPAHMQGYRPDARSTADLLALIVATVQLPR